MFINILLVWSIIELINWINYVFIYFNLSNTRTININNKKIDNLIEAIKNCTKNEIEDILRAAIIYKKDSLIKKNNYNLEINDLSLIEINYIIKKNILCNKKLDKIDEIRNIIENKLEIKFNDINQNRYIINEWGNLFIYFSFLPFILILIIKIVSNLIHYYMIFYLKFKYKVYENKSIGFLYNNYNPNKKTILFIHGFGFGYFPYIQLLINLQKEYNLIIIILPNISQFLYSKETKLNNKNIINSVYNFIETNNYNKINILSHSFGTLISYKITKDKRSKIIEKNISVDPIYFYLDYYKLQKHANFPFYNKENIILYLFDKLNNYLIYDSIYLKYICYRYLFGPMYWLYLNKNNNYKKMIFVFHKNDYVINSSLIYDKIKNNAKSYFLDSNDSTHGTILFNNNKYEQLINIIEN